MTPPTLSVVSLAALLAVSAALPVPAYADYPAKPIRIVSPAQPGTPGDFVVRLIAEPLAAELGQPVFVENRAGAMNTIGMTHIARSAPDGYTVGIFGSPSAVAPSLMPKLGYDTLRDVIPVRQLGWTSNVLIVRSSAPFRTLAELVDAAKARPGRLNYASGSNGTPAHLAAELFKQHAGIDVHHIPYKGAQAGVAAVLAGEVDMMFATASAVAPQVKAGTLRALATSAPRRLPALPDAPTLAEAGYALDMRDWHGIVVPAGTPRPIVERLASALQRVLNDPAVRQRLEAAGIEPVLDGTPETFGTLIHAEIDRWSKVVQAAGIRQD